MKFDNKFFIIEDLVNSSFHKFDFTIDFMCESLSISRTSLHRVIKKSTGLSTANYINDFRLEKALQFLKLEHTSIRDVAGRVGYKDPKYFTKLFKKKYGFLPSSLDSKVNKK